MSLTSQGGSGSSELLTFGPSVAPPPIALPSVPHPPAGLLNQLAIDAATRQTTVTGAGVPIPIVYGRQRIGAHLMTPGMIDNDLVLGCMWCLGEVDAIESITINDKELPPGVIVTHYLGTATQVIDPTMAAAVPGYDDVLRTTIGGNAVAIAYSVLRIPPGVTDGWPNVAAVIRGRKLYDPRTGLKAYSTNPALVLLDFISSTVYGDGRAVSAASVTAAANACDELLADSSKRREVNVVIDSSGPVASWVEALRAYAGCWVVPEGAGCKLVPDRPAASAATITAANVVQGSLTLSKRSRRAASTVVRVKYTDTSTLPWRDAEAVAYAGGVQAGTTPWREESISLPGITSYARAYREAVERLNAQHQVDLEVSWGAFDEALPYQVGDVVTMTHPVGLASKTLRIISIEPSGIGRYTIGAAEYSAAVYSDAIDTASPADSSLHSPASIDAPALSLPQSGTAYLQELSDGTVISRIFISWTPPVGQYYGSAAVRYRKSGAIDWQAGAVDQNSATAFCGPVEDGANYDIEVTAINVFGVTSAVASTSHVVIGQTEAPAPPTNFLVSSDSDGTRRLTWASPIPLPADVRSGGGYHLRYALGGSGTWANMTPLHTGVITASPYETNQLAAGTYTFAVATVDRTGNESSPVYIVATLGDPRLAGALEVAAPHVDGWPGAITNGYIDTVTGWLIATDSKTWDDFTQSWDNTPSWSMASNTLVYTHSTIDVGVVTQFTPVVSVDYAASALIEVRTSSDGTAWSAWAAPSGQVTARYIDVRGTISGNGGMLKSMNIVLDASPVTDEIIDLSTSALTGGYRIGVGDIRLPITKSFGTIRRVDVSLQNVGAGYSWVLIDKDNTVGPRIKIYNASNVLADAVIDATVRGVK